MVSFNSKKALQDAIKKQIISNDAQSIKAMMKIYAYQTADEKFTGMTYDSNGVGFNGNDSNILTSFCEQYKKSRYLSPKQLSIVKKKIGKYAGQIVNHAIEKGIWVKKENQWVPSVIF